MTTKERIEMEARKKMEKMDFDYFVNLVHDLMGEMYGERGEVYLRKSHGGWDLCLDWESWEFEGVTARDCYEQLYIALLEEQLREEIEREEQEEWEKELEYRREIDRWLEQNNGVPYGKY